MFKHMQQLKTKVKKWGNSAGVLFPKEILEKEHLKIGSTINVTISTDKVTKVKDIFGLLKGKLKKDTQTLMDEVDKELWGEP